MSEDETKMVAEIAKQSISGDICDSDGEVVLGMVVDQLIDRVVEKEANKDMVGREVTEDVITESVSDSQ